MCTFFFPTIVKGSFSLIQCVEIDNKNILYIQGNINCNTWWQIIIKVFICLNVVPQIVVISMFPCCLEEKRMNVRIFIFACLFPLPTILYLLLKNIPLIRKTKNTNVEDDIGLEETDTETTMEAHNPLKENEEQIVHILLQDYKCLSIYGIRFTWLGIHKVYRLILVVCNTYVTEPVPKLLIMTSILMVITIRNVFLKPYKDTRTNKTATLSYMANLCIAMLNLWKTVLVTFDCKTNCSFKDTLLWYFNLAENILMNWLPIIAALIWLVYSLFEKCRSKSKNEQE